MTCKFFITLILTITGIAAAYAKDADTIYYGGDILTMNGDSPNYAEAVVVEAGKIAFVGSKTKALEMKGANTKVRNLNGKFLSPSFIDPHGHFMFALNMVNQVNVANPPVGTAVDIPSTIEALKAYRAKAKIPAGGWLVGWGYDAEGLKEGRHITRRDLDPHFPDLKVMLIHVSGHGAILNSLALAASGIDENTVTPPGGIINRLPGSNEPAGLIMETAYLPAMQALLVEVPVRVQCALLIQPGQWSVARVLLLQLRAFPMRECCFHMQAARLRALHVIDRCRIAVDQQQIHLVWYLE